MRNSNKEKKNNNNGMRAIEVRGKKSNSKRRRVAAPSEMKNKRSQ